MQSGSLLAIGDIARRSVPLAAVDRFACVGALVILRPGLQAVDFGHGSSSPHRCCGVWR
jgi:hypothetical protein